MIVKINDDISVNIQCKDIQVEQNKVYDKLCDDCKGAVGDMLDVVNIKLDWAPLDWFSIDELENYVTDYSCSHDLDNDCNNYMTQILNLELVKMTDWFFDNQEGQSV